MSKYNVLVTPLVLRQYKPLILVWALPIVIWIHMAPDAKDWLLIHAYHMVVIGCVLLVTIAVVVFPPSSLPAFQFTVDSEGELHFISPNQDAKGRLTPSSLLFPWALCCHFVSQQGKGQYFWIFHREVSELEFRRMARIINGIKLARKSNEK